jgi:integrase
MEDQMARGFNRLTAASLRSKKRGLHCDGNHLLLQVTPAKDGVGTNRSWIFRYVLAGRARSMGLGSTAFISLKDAREAAIQYSKLLHSGVDPIAHRDEARAAKIAESAKSMTFEQCAAAYMTAHRNEWKNEQHAQQWPASLRRYAYPVLGKVTVATIDTALIMKVLEPIWQEVPETASRLRGRIESILDWATVSELRRGDNPARWSGHLEHLLSKKGANSASAHHAAMPWQEVPAFMVKLREVDGTIARALEFLILTASRRQEVRGMVWDEIELKNSLWTIPADRMKAGKEHRVPLSARCIEILTSNSELRNVSGRSETLGGLCFPGPRTGGQFGTKNLSDLLERLGANCTTHGFRSSFRDWAGESTNFPREVCEAALAHVSGDQTERAYRRGDALDKRRQLMNAWSRFCSQPVQVTKDNVRLIGNRS